MKTAKDLQCLYLLIGRSLLLMIVLASSVAYAFADVSQRSVILLFDVSGSMKQTDADCARGEAAKLLVSLLDDGDRVGVIEFGDGVESVTGGLVQVSAARAEVAKVVERCSTEADYTNIVEALEFALQLVEGMGADGREAAPPEVILLTDGKDTARGTETQEREERLTAVLTALVEHDVRVHSVGLSDQADRALLGRIQNETQGDLSFAASAADLLGPFFGLSRMLGGRWLVFEGKVASGQKLLNVPQWAKSGLILFLPERTSAAPLAMEGHKAVKHAGYQLLTLNEFAGRTLALDVPSGGGRLIFDVREELRLRLEIGEKIPSEVPFLCSARLLSLEGEGLGSPEFLQDFQVFVEPSWEGVSARQPLYDNGRQEDGNAGDGAFAGVCLLTTPPKGEPAHLVARGRAPFSREVSATRPVQVVARPVNLALGGGGPGLLSVGTDVAVNLENTTDVPLRVHATVRADGVDLASERLTLQPGKSNRIDVETRRKPLMPSALDVKVVSDDSRVLLEESSTIWPWATLPGLLTLVAAGLLLSMVLPRRSAKGHRASLELESELGETRSWVGDVTSEGSIGFPEAPEPFSHLGRILVPNGMWRRTPVFEPTEGITPSFSRGGKRAGKGRYKLTRYSRFEVETNTGRGTCTIIRR